MNFVLVHGAWHGGWCWRDVAGALRTKGHTVFTPTLTGLGERAHLLTPSVSLATFIDDICALIECEELQDVVLVGHSFAGLVISGVADRLKPRIKQLIYLDALIVQSGQSSLWMLPPEAQQKRTRTCDPEGLRTAAPDPARLGVSDPAQAAWVTRRVVAHPARTFTDPLILTHPLGNGLPKTYIAATDPPYAPFVDIREWVRSQPDWNWQEIAAGHNSMVTAAAALSDLLVQVAH